MTSSTVVATLLGSLAGVVGTSALQFWRDGVSAKRQENSDINQRSRDHAVAALRVLSGVSVREDIPKLLKAADVRAFQLRPSERADLKVEVFLTRDAGIRDLVGDALVVLALANQRGQRIAGFTSAIDIRREAIEELHTVLSAIARQDGSAPESGSRIREWRRILEQ